MRAARHGGMAPVPAVATVTTTVLQKHPLHLFPFSDFLKLLKAATLAICLRHLNFFQNSEKIHMSSILL